jgi:NADPH-dependent curcumin reductase CurA
VTDRMQCWYFNKRPREGLDADTFVKREVPVPDIGEGEVLIRMVLMTMDATNRVWLTEWDSYIDPVNVGDPMRAFTLGEVVQSKHPDFAVGTLVSGLGPWAEYYVSDGSGLQAFPHFEGVDLVDAFGILTVAGPTALVGLREIAKLKAGETIAITAAAGAVGALTGQIAKIMGARVIGVAGSDAKCAWLTDELGFDAAINYKTEDVVASLRKHAPDGLDVHFENVGGEMLDAGLTVMKNYGRVVICGLIATYGAAGEVPGPYMFRNMIMRRLTMRGFVILDYLDQYPELWTQLLQWIKAGRLKYRLNLLEGLDRAPEALGLLFSGGNDGKVMVRVGADPA